MKNTFLFLSLIFSTYSFGQDTCVYKNYYTNITKALTEKHSNNNPQKANAIFKETIASVPFTLGKDLEEALLNAMEIEDFDFCNQIVIQLAKGGIPLHYFSKYKKLKTTDWWKDFVNDFPKYKLYYQNNFDLELKEKTLALIKQDVLFNEKCHQFRRQEIDMTQEKLIEGASKIISTFQKLIIEHGFPSEINIGYHFENGEIQLDSGIQATIIHIYQRGDHFLDEVTPYLICQGHRNSYNINTPQMMGRGEMSGYEIAMKKHYKKYKK